MTTKKQEKIEQCKNNAKELTFDELLERLESVCLYYGDAVDEEAEEYYLALIEIYRKEIKRRYKGATK